MFWSARVTYVLTIKAKEQSQGCLHLNLYVLIMVYQSLTHALIITVQLTVSNL